MAAKAVKIVIDASSVGGLDAETRAKMQAEAMDLLTAGDVEAARSIVEQLKTANEAGNDVTTVPLTTEEEAEVKERATADAEANDAAEASAKNEKKMRDAIGKEMKAALELADKIKAGDASEAEQRKALAAALGGVVRLSRIVLGAFDEAV